MKKLIARKFATARRRTSLASRTKYNNNLFQMSLEESLFDHRPQPEAKVYYPSIITKKPIVLRYGLYWPKDGVPTSTNRTKWLFPPSIYPIIERVMLWPTSAKE